MFLYSSLIQTHVTSHHPLTHPTHCAKHGGINLRSSNGCVRGLRFRRTLAVTCSAAATGSAGSIVMVVESPTKATKIQKFLGDQYVVLASYGHVRDLAAKTGAVLPDEGFAMTWQIPPVSLPRLKGIEDALLDSHRRGKQSSSRVKDVPSTHLVLATDPDREGEAISWHVAQELEARGVLRGCRVERVTFNEITAEAVRTALAAPRQVSQPLVDAYLARRALDHLVGFTLSPVLWRKLPGAKSAGRVQSVALRLLCEREVEVESAVLQSYFSVQGQVSAHSSLPFDVQLVKVSGKRLGKMELSDGDMAKALAARIQGDVLKVIHMTASTLQRSPPAPFITSTLQQAASSKLGYSASRTMSLAQKLFEGNGTGEGLITYMRTDGVSISSQAVLQLRELLTERFGPDAVPAQPRIHISRVKNAQEAHEAIRPTNPRLHPSQLPSKLDADLVSLYDLIWRRTCASQMSNAVLEQVGVDMVSSDGQLVVHGGGSRVTVLGYLAIYDDSTSTLDEVQSSADNDVLDDGRLPLADSNGQESSGTLSKVNPSVEAIVKLQAGDMVQPRNFSAVPHTSRPPPRYSEAALIKALEGLGIGRPSTYATILGVLQTRSYCTRVGRTLSPTSLGRVLSAFLAHYFAPYVDYSFTSNMEAQLDAVAEGTASWRAVLKDFWGPFQSTVADMTPVGQREVFDMLDQVLAPCFFPTTNLLLPNPTSLGSPQQSLSTELLHSEASSSAHRNGSTDFLKVSHGSNNSASGSRSGGELVASATALLERPANISESERSQVASEVRSLDPRVCPLCQKGRLVIKPSRSGGFIGCTQFGSTEETSGCGYARPLLAAQHAFVEGQDGSMAPIFLDPSSRVLGAHPETGQSVMVKLGPYGLYVELGPLTETSTPDSNAGLVHQLDKEAVPHGEMSAQNQSLSEADEAEPSGAKKKGRKKATALSVKTKQPKAPVPRRTSLPKGMSICDITLEHAILLLSLPRLLGPHPETGEPVTSGTGIFGPFVAHQGVFASIALKSSGWTPFTVTLDAAMEFFAKKAERVAAREAKGLPALFSRKIASKVKLLTKSVKGKPEKAAERLVVQPEAGQVRLSKTISDSDVVSAAQKPVRNCLSKQQRLEEKTVSKKGTASLIKMRTVITEASSKKQTMLLQRVADGKQASVPTKSGLSDVGVSGMGPSLNPYLQYSARNRQRLKNLNPAAKPSDLVKMLAAEWRDLGQVQRDLYRSSPNGSSHAGGIEVGSEAVVSAKSTTHSNPYLQYNSVHRKRIKEQHPTAKASEVMSLLAAEWRGLDDRERAVYKSSQVEDELEKQEAKLLCV